jgi:hypothetical protein
MNVTPFDFWSATDAPSRLTGAITGSAGTGMDREIGSVTGTGAGRAGGIEAVAAGSAAGPDGTGAAATGAVAGAAGTVFVAFPTIVETFFEMNALDFAAFDDPLPGS